MKTSRRWVAALALTLLAVGGVGATICGNSWYRNADRVATTAGNSWYSVADGNSPTA
jgi:hypothetical protein